MDRIHSVHFALDNDDGARTHQYDKADIILVGVSRCGKTPTSLYFFINTGLSNFANQKHQSLRIFVTAFLSPRQMVRENGKVRLLYLVYLNFFR